MSAPLRVFISSTMNDLANERQEVVDRLKALNLEPVNAEGILPDGNPSWQRISDELRGCHMFVLILGTRYGWIPDAGPHASEGKAVTHLEFDEACRLGLVVLPFLKKLDYDTMDKTSDDARRRDEFRALVKDWEGGRFVGGFHLASDLAMAVTQAVVGVLSSGWLHARVAERARQLATTPRSATPSSGQPIDLPPKLVEAVQRGRAVLFAGSGMSLAAGLPSALAFAELMQSQLRDQVKDYRGLATTAAGFAGVASDVETLLGRPWLSRLILQLMDPPQGLAPTAAHHDAVRLFDTIITTNYDGLLEEAARDAGRGFVTIVEELENELNPLSIVHLHGAIAAPQSLTVTERQVLLLDATRPKLWAAVRQLLAERIVVVVGSSLRDPSVIRLFAEAAPTEGYAVVPVASSTTTAQLRGWQLDPIVAHPDAFFAALAAAALKSAS